MSYHANNENINQGINEAMLKLAPPHFPRTPYNGYSIVDGLRAIYAQTSFDYRTKIAEINGMGSYLGNPEQNLHMLNLLKQGMLIRPY